MWQNRNVPLVSTKHYKGLAAFFEHWHAHIKEDDKKIIEVFLGMPMLHVVARLKYVIKCRFKLFDSVTLLLIKMIVRKYM